jgi:serine/threonine protein phosphatase PrpC
VLLCLVVSAAAGCPCPLTAEPEVTTHQLQEGDEFMLLGCDGLWDVFPSQRAVEFARARCGGLGGGSCRCPYPLPSWSLVSKTAHLLV